ncbi:TetR family transcriptional regulator [Agromyces sp. CFH 90414]|uniref:TetR family transcriptional regulator n=1 Tax=Agromyces agglutinans TaxID=2662258 RepID=A0A6I2F9I8_9MICO|nr:TetR family transcriptional regulator [Agromyces agglutinans]MRG60904.1 TetR family transcriptional regulator [Agromyces agglutinans]
MARIPAPERREALIDAALRVVARDGISHATTRAIVAEAGMSLASFHYAFASRDELIDELIRTVVERAENEVVPSLDPHLSVRERIEAGLLRYFGHLKARPSHEQAMLELTWYALRAPERHPLAVSQYARYREFAMAALQRATTDSGITWTLPLDQVAQVLVALTDGLTTTWLVDRDDEAALRYIGIAADTLSRLADAR